MTTKLCIEMGLVGVLVENRVLADGLAQSSSIKALGFHDVVRDRRSARASIELDGQRPALIQFTSGTTAGPRPVCVSSAQLVSNIRSILERLQVGPGESTCSWLPLSHDMGLIGMVLCTLVAGSVSYAGGSRLCLMDPRAFVGSPQSWSDLCRAENATITGSPNFGLDHLHQSLRRTPEWGRIRAVLVGGERIRPETVTSSESIGLCSSKIVPCYGMAEATLAVTMGEPGAVPRVEPSAEGLGPYSDRLYVSAGHALSGVTVGVNAAPGCVGTIEISGQTVTGIAGAGRRPRSSARYQTGDLGFMHSGDLFPVGRSDDTLSIRGRLISAQLVDDQCRSIDGVRRGRLVSFQDVKGDLAVAVELSLKGEASVGAVVRQIRNQAKGVCGIGPTVYTSPRGTLPVTSSGKLSRSRVEAMFADRDPTDIEVGVWH